MRKRIAVACCCVVFFVVGWAFGQQALDASRWSEYGKRDELARTMYVKGYLDGYADGDSAMEKITVVLTKDDPPDASKKKLVAPSGAPLGTNLIGLGKNRDVTVGKIKEAMSSFYGD
jgi:hypothetical protein